MVAWSMAIICSIPQSIVFSLQTHPIIRTYRQCMNTITITDKHQELLYFAYFITLSWLLPIIVMSICYLSIIITICKRTKLNHILDNTKNIVDKGKCSVILNTYSIKNIIIVCYEKYPNNSTLRINLLLLLDVQTSSLIGKAKMKTIKVTGVLILGFFLTWSPYQINCLW